MIDDEFIIGGCLPGPEEPHLKESPTIGHADRLTGEFCLAIHCKCLPLCLSQIILGAGSALEHSEIIGSYPQLLSDESGILEVSGLVLEL